MKLIAIIPVTYFKGTATRAFAAWTQSTLGVGNATVDLHLTDDTGKEITSGVVSVPQEAYDSWADDAAFLGAACVAGGFTPVEPVVFVEPVAPTPVVEAATEEVAQ
jgi:hypothetical protein